LKPTRGPAAGWIQQIPPARRGPLLSLAVLLLFICSLVLYERFSLRAPGSSVAQSPTDGTPPVTAVGEAGAAAEGEASTAAAKVNAERPKHLLHPLQGGLRLIQAYGFAYSHTYADYRLHPGIDLAAEPGELVMAAANGKVLSVEESPLEGRVLTLDHQNGLITRYAGLGKLSVPLDAAVQAGQIIGQIGDPPAARAAAGSHLHFQVLTDGEPVNPVDYFKRSAANE
jgi:murein DD-endopeptidase MepM/ murein hydrolase activator NlpD